MFSLIPQIHHAHSHTLFCFSSSCTCVTRSFIFICFSHSCLILCISPFLPPSLLPSRRLATSDYCFRLNRCLSFSPDAYIFFSLMPPIHHAPSNTHTHIHFFFSSSCTCDSRPFIFIFIFIFHLFFSFLSISLPPSLPRSRRWAASDYCWSRRSIESLIIESLVTRNNF